MATIRKRGGAWQVQVRRTGYAPQSKTFASKADAQAWAREKEVAIDRGEAPTARQRLRSQSLLDLLDRYEREITSKKRGADRERFKLRVIRRHALSKTQLSGISSAMLAAYRDDRLAEVSQATVRRELALLSHVFEIARKEWGVPMENPVKLIRLPSPAKARERRLTEEEFKAFWKAVESARASWLKPFVILAIETGMRRGELLKLRWADVDLLRSTARLDLTKNGHGRTVPLTPLATQTLQALPRSAAIVFPLTEVAVRQSWMRLVERAGLRDFRLHDLRHEAISRFFELGLGVPEVALVSGHRDVRMLTRYTHLRPERIAQKLGLLLRDA